MHIYHCKEQLASSLFRPCGYWELNQAIRFGSKYLHSFYPPTQKLASTLFPKDFEWHLLQAFAIKEKWYIFLIFLIDLQGFYYFNDPWAQKGKVSNDHSDKRSDSNNNRKVRKCLQAPCLTRNYPGNLKILTKE